MAVFLMISLIDASVKVNNKFFRFLGPKNFPKNACSKHLNARRYFQIN